MSKGHESTPGKHAQWLHTFKHIIHAICTFTLYALTFVKYVDMQLCMWVCVYVCACVRACVRACVAWMTDEADGSVMFA